MLSRSFLPLVSRVAACLALGGWLTAAGTARADNLRLELAELAGEIQKVVEQQNQSAIAVGEFTGPSHTPTSAGPAIEQALTLELQARKVRVEKQAALEVKGDYRDATDAETKLLMLKIRARVFDSNGDVVVELHARAVHGNTEVAKVLGITASLPPKGDYEERNQELRRRLRQPSVHVDGPRVSSRAESAFQVEVLVQDGPGGRVQPRDARVEGGLAFVPIRRDECYEVRLTNKSAFEAAATLSIDGLDQFAFSDVKDPKTGKPRYTVRIVPAGGSTVIRGWHRTNEVADSFLVTEFSRSAAARRLQNTAKVGTLVVTFAACWQSNAQRPPDEQSDDRAANATGQGPPVAQKLREVRRTIGAVRDTVSIRYSK
jgi:hypothetical protein